MKRNILVIGSGGREHAIGWKLSQSPEVDKVFHAPGNGGTQNNIPVNPMNLEGLLRFAEKEKCFTVVGPEGPLSRGIVDLFQEKGMPIFGPSRKAARLETSKVFAKNFMNKYNIPTADFRIFQRPEDALDYIRSKVFPIVVKVDGLASGKGAIVCRTSDEANDAIERIMIKKEFGAAGEKVVVEDYLRGYEVSFICISDGVNVVPLETSQDHKQVFDGDIGPNTGGMGSYSPVPMVSDKLYESILKNIIVKTIDGMRFEGIKFKGVLYAGIMVSNDKPYVLEFNCRFGDPETQPQLLRMNSYLLPYLDASLNSNLDKLEVVKWKPGAAVSVVMASRGYPGTYDRGQSIKGLDVARTKDVMIFHSGTSKKNNNIVTNGGRVLSITAIGNSLSEAVRRAYEVADTIEFEGAHYRKDIGYQALSYLRDN